MTNKPPRKRYAPSSRVTDRYDFHRTTLNRWVKDEMLGFPKPKRIRGRNYWDEDELDAWDAARAGDPASDLPPHWVPKRNPDPKDDAPGDQGEAA